MPVLDPEADADCVIAALRAGGAAIVPLDVAYAVFGHSAASVSAIYRAKGRSFAKPNGTLGNLDMFRELHRVDQRARDVVGAVVADYGLPLSFVAPFRADHPFFAALDPFVMERSTRAGTLDLLLNAGPLHAVLARRSLEAGFPIVGSSANRSLAGSKFRLADIEPEVREIAAVALDYGLSRYANPAGISSTIIDLRDYSVIRYGVCFPQIRDILARHFAIELPDAAPLAAAG
jgi:tRNA A37 threonylcarbamoyladenosine synthetase subunit TsaC/SUA5/YrdC